MPVSTAQSLCGRSLRAVIVMHTNATDHCAQTFDRIDFDAKVVGCANTTRTHIESITVYVLDKSYCIVHFIVNDTL